MFLRQLHLLPYSSWLLQLFSIWLESYLYVHLLLYSNYDLATIVQPSQLRGLFLNQIGDLDLEHFEPVLQKKFTLASAGNLA
ncbi:hypothetical protein CMK15_05625 [Candidatus Poribacteria bacterium]|nr:hypothetical protein [Candidatus Poribacteria bacterium]